MSPSITYVRRVFVNFQDGAYDWIDVKEFAVSPSHVAPNDALALLLGHVRYRDSYVTGDSQDINSVDLHGPYRLAHLSPRIYEPVKAADLDGALRVFMTRYCTEDEVIPRMARYENEVVPLLEGSTDWFRLPQLPESAQHEFGWVLDDFIEFVTLDRQSGRLLLIVAAAD